MTPQRIPDDPQIVSRIRQLYNHEKKSTYEVAKLFGVSQSTILKYMDKHNIPRRSKGLTSADSKNRQTKPKSKQIALSLHQSQAQEKYNETARINLERLRKESTIARRILGDS